MVAFSLHFFCFSFHVFAEELLSNNYLEEANIVFIKGAQGGMRASDELYDLMIVEDCKSGDHSNALTIAYEMEAAGRMATTFHFNCLLSVQVKPRFLILHSLLLSTKLKYFLIWPMAINLVISCRLHVKRQK